MELVLEVYPVLGEIVSDILNRWAKSGEHSPGEFSSILHMSRMKDLANRSVADPESLK